MVCVSARFLGKQNAPLIVTLSGAYHSLAYKVVC